MCVADLTEKSLRKCAKKKYVHVTFKRSGESTNRRHRYPIREKIQKIQQKDVETCVKSIVN